MSEPLRLALDVADEALSARIAAALEAAGVEIVPAGDEADATISAPEREGAPDLTPREEEVLALLATGASNKEIGRALGITPHTAKFHVGRLLDKLDATGRTDAVAHALRSGVLQL